MALETQRQLLDQLMGKERNLVDEQKTNKKRSFTDPDVDKYYLCGCSPHELFRNTNSDLGPNPLVPDDKLKEEWEALSQEEKDKYGFEFDLMKHLEKVVERCDRRIERNRQRADMDARMSTEDQERLDDLETQIRPLTEQAITVAEEDPEKSKELNSQIEKLSEQKEAILEKHKNKKRLIVCEVSGNLLSSDDTEDRLKAHHRGKQYQGWKLVRSTLERLRTQNPPRPQRQFRGWNDREDRGRDRRNFQSASWRDRDQSAPSQVPNTFPEFRANRRRSPRRVSARSLSRERNAKEDHRQPEYRNNKSGSYSRRRRSSSRSTRRRSAGRGRKRSRTSKSRRSASRERRRSNRSRSADTRARWKRRSRSPA